MARTSRAAADQNDVAPTSYRSRGWRRTGSPCSWYNAYTRVVCSDVRLRLARLRLAPRRLAREAVSPPRAAVYCCVRT